MMIGLDRVEGYFGPEVLEGDHPLAEAPAVDAREARRLQDQGALLVDVRASSEWRAGHPEGAHHLHLGTLPDRVDELPADGLTVFLCQSGARSAIAQSIALGRGLRAVNVAGGIEAWQRAGLPVERGA